MSGDLEPNDREPPTPGPAQDPAKNPQGDPATPPAPGTEQAPAGFLERRLPGPRWAWALIAALVLVGGIAGQFSGRGSPEAAATLVRYQVRTLNLMWRASAWIGATSDGDGRLLMKTAERSAGANSRGAAEAKQETTDVLGGLGPEGLDELITEALRVDQRLAARPDVRGGGTLAEEVIAHCLATEQDRLAARLILRLKTKSADATALAVLLPGQATATDAARTALKAAKDHSQTAGFGRSWSPWTRDRLRLRLAVAAGSSPPAGLALDLVERDRFVAASAWTTLQLALLALLFGVATAFAWSFRGQAERAQGRPRWAWLRDRYPGLPNDNPYLPDPLVPWVAVAAWMLAQFAAAPLQLLPGMRHPSPFAALISAMVGLMAVQALLGWLSPARVPVVTAARLGGDPAIPWAVATTAGLRALTLLLPTMLAAALLSALLLPQTDQLHAAVDLSLARSDAVGLIAMGLAAVVVAPLAEELLFRGIVFRQIRQRLGFAPALLTSSLLFAVMHGDPSQMLTYSVLGGGFALGYAWTGSLWTPVIMHAVWNLATVVLMNCVVLS